MLSIKTIGKVTKRYRHLIRYQQIIGIILKYGFENIVEAVNIDRYIESGLRFIPFTKPHEKVARLSKNQRIRLTLEELGPTFIKMGQVLSVRPDLIPVDLTRELSKLQDHVPPFGFTQVCHIIESEFGKPWNDMFLAMDEAPFASASIGQVHKAQIDPATPIAVKIQRPGIRKTIEADLEIMHHLAQIMENNIEEVARFHPVKIVEEFAATLEKELDYSIEATSMEQMGHQFEKDHHIHIPKVYKAQSSDRVLSMEYIEGFKADDIEGIDAAGLDRKAITRAGADFIMRQVFEFGFFHADPHPGNIFILADQRICPVDFGMTGFVSLPIRELFIDLLQTLASGDTGMTARLLCELAEYDTEPSHERLEKDVALFSAMYLAKPLKEIKTGRMVNQFLEICSAHGLRIPPDLFLMIKAFVAIEGVARRLDPDFDMVSHARPYVRAATLKKYSAPRIAREMAGIARETFSLFRTLPSDTSKLISMVKQGKLKTVIQIEGLERLLTTQDQTSNRISFSIIIAALILGSAIVLNSKIPPLFFGVSVIGIAGFIAAAVMGIWLLVAIVKKGRL